MDEPLSPVTLNAWRVDAEEANLICYGYPNEFEQQRRILTLIAEVERLTTTRPMAPLPLSFRLGSCCINVGTEDCHCARNAIL